MATGKVWNGGEVPVIGDPMYMSIVDEMREPLGKNKEKLGLQHSQLLSTFYSKIL